MVVRWLSKNLVKVGLGLAIANLICLAFLFWPVTENQRRQASVLLENVEYYTLSRDGQILYFEQVDSVRGLRGVDFTSDACTQKSYEVGFFSSRRGKIVTSKDAFVSVYDSLFFKTKGADLLKHTSAYLDERLETLQKQIKELEYYVETHMSADDGFEEMKTLLSDCMKSRAHLDSLKNTVDYFEEKSSDIHWERACKLSAYYVPGDKRRRYDCSPLIYHSDEAVTQLTEKGLPQHAVSIHNPMFGMEDLEYEVDSLTLDSLRLTDATRFVGILKGKDFIYKGEIRAGSPFGMGTCINADGTQYIGAWQNGLLNGLATLKDTAGVQYSGVWAYDHLAGGNAVYPDGTVYKGSLLEDSIFDGAGEIFYPDGCFYYGSWANGVKEGFGMSVDAEGKVQCGSWKEDQFEGERLLYTADRVYGIDVARYQHLTRRKRPCNISWKYIRITSLGTKSKKRISGVVSYPVSFVYMKATEGASVLNKYFKSDYKQARTLGIHVGSYHFFSSAPVEQQLNWFFKNNTYKKGDLPPVLDLEPTDSYIKNRWGSDEKMFAQVQKWLKSVEERYGVKPILYVNQLFIKNHLSHAPEEIQSYDLWVARYGEFKPYSHMIYWQLSPDGKVSGIQSDVDINVFNGSKERFEEYVNSFK